MEGIIAQTTGLGERGRAMEKNQRMIEGYNRERIGRLLPGIRLGNVWVVIGNWRGDRMDRGDFFARVVGNRQGKLVALKS